MPRTCMEKSLQYFFLALFQAAACFAVGKNIPEAAGALEHEAKNSRQAYPEVSPTMFSETSCLSTAKQAGFDIKHHLAIL